MPILYLTTILAATLGGCSVSATTLLRVGTTTEMAPLSPVDTNGLWYSTGYTGFLFMPLITYRAPDARFGPCLAQSWEVAADNRSIRFRLHSGARWHDGPPVTAEDVAFTLDYVKEHELIGQLWRFLDHTEVLDTLTVVVHFTEPVAFYQSMFFPWPKILPKHIWNEVSEPDLFQGTRAMVGCGPFEFARYDADARVSSFRKVADFFGGNTAVEQIDIRYYGSNEALVLALKQGDIDVVMGATNNIPNAYVAAVEGEDPIGLVEIEDSGVPLTLVFHATRHPTRLAVFRQAVAAAIDYGAFIPTVMRGLGRIPERGFVPPAAWTYGGPFPLHVHDPEQAGSLLDSIGFKDVDGDGLREDENGDDFTLELIPETWQSNGEELRATELLVCQLKNVGIPARLTKYLVEEEYEILWERRDYQAYVGHATHASVRDGGHVYFANYQDYSYGTFEDSVYFEILDRITHAQNVDEYLHAVRQAQAFNSSALPGVPLTWSSKIFAFRKDRFSGWQGMTGYGFPNYDSWFSLRPVSMAAARPTASPSAGYWPIIGLAAAFLAAASWLWQRRKL